MQIKKIIFSLFLLIPIAAAVADTVKIERIYELNRKLCTENNADFNGSGCVEKPTSPVATVAQDVITYDKISDADQVFVKKFLQKCENDYGKGNVSFEQKYVEHFNWDEYTCWFKDLTNTSDEQNSIEQIKKKYENATKLTAAEVRETTTKKDKDQLKRCEALNKELQEDRIGFAGRAGGWGGVPFDERGCWTPAKRVK